MSLRNAAAALLKELEQSPPAPEIHPELVEEGTVSEVMLVGDCRQRIMEIERAHCKNTTRCAIYTPAVSQRGRWDQMILNVTSEPSPAALETLDPTEQHEN